ncbi:Hypothetical protein D9617_18g033660 [Elsinoe fawcettii]|nr:Hypothetical protein D9617_18g033660 [Elsinoe fawcettii]
MAADAPKKPQKQIDNGENGENDQNGQQDDKQESLPPVPYIQEPQLDPSGKRSQRTVEQQKKQEELVKAYKRMNGTDTNRSRSASRKERRRRIQQEMTDGKHMHTSSLTALEEADANGEMKAMRPFERIGPDSTSMDGPVTYARAERGEIPVRGTNPGQPYYNPPKKFGSGTSKLDETDGLKLTLEANLEIEIELKASIRGDLTLSLMA